MIPTLVLWLYVFNGLLGDSASTIERILVATLVTVFALSLIAAVPRLRRAVVQSRESESRG